MVNVDCGVDESKLVDECVRGGSGATAAWDRRSGVTASPSTLVLSSWRCRGVLSAARLAGGHSGKKIWEEAERARAEALAKAGKVRPKGAKSNMGGAFIGIFWYSRHVLQFSDH